MILVVKHISVEGPGTLLDHLKTNYGDVKVIDLELGDKFPAIDDVSAVIYLGGPMNVYQMEEYPSLKKSEDFLIDVLKTKTPFLGICLGAQILAKVTGAKVKKCETRELGWYKVSLTPEGKKDPLCKALYSSFETFQWHEDSFDIPENATLLATSTDCTNQAFRFSDFAWGIQFHPEMNKEAIAAWCEYYEEDALKPKLMQGYFNRQMPYLRQARNLAASFIKLFAKESIDENIDARVEAEK